MLHGKTSRNTVRAHVAYIFVIFNLPCTAVSNKLTREHHPADSLTP